MFSLEKDFVTKSIYVNYEISSMNTVSYNANSEMQCMEFIQCLLIGGRNPLKPALL